MADNRTAQNMIAVLDYLETHFDTVVRIPMEVIPYSMLYFESPVVTAPNDEGVMEKDLNIFSAWGYGCGKIYIRLSDRVGVQTIPYVKKVYIEQTKEDFISHDSQNYHHNGETERSPGLLQSIGHTKKRQN